MPDQSDTHSATQVADRLRRLVEQHPWSNIDQSLTVTVSAGVATLGTTDTMERLIARADNGLYAAKNSGRNQVCAG